MILLGTNRPQTGCFYRRYFAVNMQCGRSPETYSLPCYCVFFAFLHYNSLHTILQLQKVVAPAHTLLCAVKL